MLNYLIKKYLKINVIENPIIQSVKINGIEKIKFMKKLKKVTLKIEKYPFVENKINEQVNFIKKYFKIIWILFCKIRNIY